MAKKKVVELTPDQWQSMYVYWTAYSDARKAYEAAQEVEKRTGRLKEEAEGQLIEFLDGLQLRGKQNVGGREFHVSRQVRISVTKENHEDVVGWLSITYGREAAQDFLKLSVDRWAVERAIKDEINAKKATIESYPDFLKVHSQPRINVSGWDSDGVDPTQ